MVSSRNASHHITSIESSENSRPNGTEMGTKAEIIKREYISLKIRSENIHIYKED